MPTDLDALAAKIAAARAVPPSPTPDNDVENKRVGLQAGAELVTAICAGILLGWGADVWLGTRPLFLLLGLVLGFSTAIYNIHRITMGRGTAVGFSALRKGAKADKTTPDE